MLLRQMLDDGDSKAAATFLSGALWAANEFLQAQLIAADEASDRSAASLQGMLWGVLARRLRSVTRATPTELLAHAKATPDLADIRLDQVSRALGDLLREGVAEPTDPPTDGDRRRRYFRAATPPAPAPLDAEDPPRVRR